MLVSINERLGELCDRKAGRDFTPLTDDWLHDLFDLATTDAESAEDGEGSGDSPEEWF